MNTIPAYLNKLCICKKIRPSIPPPGNRLVALINSYIFRLFSAFCVFSVGATGIAVATTFVVIPSNSGFFVGADSMRSSHQIGEECGKANEYFCKIRYRGNQIMLTSGHTNFALKYADGTIKPTATFDPIANNVLSLGTNIEAKRDLLEKKAEAFLRKEMDIYDKGHQPLSPELYYRMVIDGAFISDALTDYGVYAFKIEIIDWKTRKFHHLHWDPGGGNLRLGIPIVFGNDEGWTAYQSGHTIAVHNPTEQEAVTTIKTILQLQVQKTPNDVGPPFSIALLKASSLDLIEGGLCKANRNNGKPKEHKAK